MLYSLISSLQNGINLFVERCNRRIKKLAFKKVQSTAVGLRSRVKIQLDNH